LAAYKDLSSPWKELLTYYNQVQDMSLRWDIVTERFQPKGMVDEHLFQGAPDEVPHLRGPVVLEHVTLRTATGNTLLEDINQTITPGARVAIKVTNQSERTALAELLTREVNPTRGTVKIADYDLSGLHQAVIAARIGYAHSRPYLFDGTLGSNLMMPLMTSPKTILWDPENRDRFANESMRSGNSPDSLRADWLDPDLADLRNADDIRKWWFELVTAMGIDEFMFQRMLGARIDAKLH
jgi:putative ABC transport system ATP-binding protein